MNDQLELLRTAARQARAIAAADGHRTRIAVIALRNFSALSRLDPVDRAERIAVVDRMLGMADERSA